jgi:uncharacterized protein YifE (UPF0438 family)
VDLQGGEFYLGSLTEGGEPLLYEADDLTTHGVIVGMTGSGKTGLGVDLIEEALLSGIPCLILDPKGDMGNLALNFPELDPSDFEPWVDAGTAAKEGKSVAELADETAEAWRRGLEGAGIGLERLLHLRENTEMTIYTPGSGAGMGLSVLGSLAAPDLDWETEAEVIRDEIEALVSSVLVLAGIDSDPVSGREHILLANIVETLWRNGEDLDLAALVGQIPNPPFRKLGVFDIDTFFPAEDRTKLALRLNGLLASPSFASWLEGEPLDIAGMLTGGDKTKAAIIYMSHLSDSERQFLVTLLLSKLITWMRGLPGTSELRALIYMDEVFGFVPPTAEPPAKKPILTILKQARAYGVGMVLSTQNPVDLDYKAMSNAGTWIVGRLQTENDKRRILEGIESASGAVDVNAFDRLISNLEKRQFVLHSTKSAQPRVFSTRWAMSYLAGPLTRDQVTLLMKERRAKAQATVLPTPEPTGPPPPSDAVPVAPQVADGTDAVFMSPSAPWAQTVGASSTGKVYRAAVAATVQLLYDDTRAGVNQTESYEAIIYPLDATVDPAEVIAVDHDERDFLAEVPPGASFVSPEAKIHTKAFWSGLESDLKSYLVAARKITVFRNPKLGLYSRVGEPEEEFLQRCREAADEAADRAVAKLQEKYRTRIDRTKDQISTAEARVADLEGDATARSQAELLSGAGDLLGAFLGGRSRANPLSQIASRRAATRKAKARVEAARQRLSDKELQLEELENDLGEEIIRITEEWADAAEVVEEIEIPLERTDVRVADLKLVWLPIP